MRRVALARWPDGQPVPQDFRIEDAPAPEPAEGEALVRVTHLSLDPLPRVRMQARPPFGPPMALDAAVEGRGVGVVVASRAPGLAEGDLVVGELGWRGLAALPAAALTRVEGEPAHAHLNALGATGLAACFVAESLSPGDGETVLVAPAAGAVGNLVLQMARQIAPGARLVGGVVGAAQAAFVREQGFEAIDCAAERWPDLGPVDALVDGVGCGFHERALAHLAPRGRIILLGYIAGYGEGPPRYGDASTVLLKRLTMEGFLLSDHADRFAEARARIAGWLADGAIRPVETIHRGLETAAAAFAAMFAPDTPPGKQIVALSEEDWR